MTKDELSLLETLRAQEKLSAPEKAKLKALERKEAKHKQAAQPKRNTTFGLTATTALKAVPFRISGEEKKIMTDSKSDLQGTELFYDRLGGKDDLSNNMQMRAALRAYAKLTDEEKVEAIREAKLSMVRGQK